MPIRSLFTSSKARSLGSAFAALIAYGAWALYANSAYPLHISIKAAITQGSYSFTLTLSLSWMMEYLFRHITEPQLRVPLTFLISCLLLYATSWGINALVGTPEILMTILPGVLIGTIYTLSYTLTLNKLRQESG